MRPLSVRLDDATWRDVERARLDAGQSRTDFLRDCVQLGLERSRQPRPPDPQASVFCSHPEGKRLGTMCVSCGTDNLALVSVATRV